MTAPPQPFPSAPRDAATAAPEFPRVLGVWDLVLFNIVAVVNLNLVPAFAAGGFPSLSLLLLALLFFLLPQGVTVSALVRRYPQQGGIYVWTKASFGEFHGFLCGWSYWLTNAFYIPTLLFYVVGVALYVGGTRYASLLADRVFVPAVALALLWLLTALCIRGLGVGKWVNNLGGIGAAITALAMIAVGWAALGRGLAHTLPPAGAWLPALTDGGAISAFSTICLAMVGLELAATMAGEIRQPEKSVPRAALVGGLACGVLYLCATLALLMTLPAAEVSVIQGVLQAIEMVTGKLGMGWIVAPLAVALSISIAGAAAAWLAGGARVPFVAGLDRFLPPALGRAHPRWHTPHVALLMQAAISSLLILFSLFGVDVFQAYVTLLRLAIITNMIPFLYLFSGGIRLARQQSGWWLATNSWVGLLATALAIAVSFLPDQRISDVWVFEAKLVSCVVLFVGTAVAFFYGYSRRQAAAPAQREV
jgi:amino acid transporter